MVGILDPLKDGQENCRDISFTILVIKTVIENERSIATNKSQALAASLQDAEKKFVFETAYQSAGGSPPFMNSNESAFFPPNPQDNYGMLCDEDKTRTSLNSDEFILNGLFTVCVIVAGCIGNIATYVLVFCHPTIKRTIRIRFGTLAFWDTALLLVSFWYYALRELIRPWTGFLWVIERIVTVIHPLSGITMTASIWTILVITLERHWSVYRPIHHRSKDTPQRAISTAVALSIFAGAYNIPQFFELQILPMCTESDTGKIRYVAGPTAFRINEHYFFLYHIVLSLVLKSLVPFMVIAALTVSISWIIHMAHRKRSRYAQHIQKEISEHSRLTSRPSSNINQSNSSGSMERETTRVLLLITTKFLCCQCLPQILNVWEALGRQHAEHNPAFHRLINISNFLVVLNSATNCLVYIACRHRLQTPPRSRGAASPSKGLFSSRKFSKHQQMAVTVLQTANIIVRSDKNSTLTTVDEGAVLLEVWRNNFRDMNPCIGTRLTLAMARKGAQYDIGDGLALHPAQPDGYPPNITEENPQIAAHGRMVSQFLGSLVLQEQGQNFTIYVDPVRICTSTHQAHEVFLRNSDYVEMRRVLEIELAPSVKYDNETMATVWRKFICRLILMMKNAVPRDQPITPQLPSQHSQSTNQSSFSTPCMMSKNMSIDR